MYVDRFSGPEFVVERPELPQLIRLDPELVTQGVLDEFKQGSKYPKVNKCIVFDYGKIKIPRDGFRDGFGRVTYDDNGRVIVNDEGFKTELDIVVTAEEADAANMDAVKTAWETELSGSLFLPHASSEFDRRHVGSAHRIDIGFFERAIRRVKGLSNDVWYHERPTIECELPLTQAKSG